MKKIGLLVKETSKDRIKDTLKESQSVFIIRYSGLSSPDITTLRQSLKGANTSIFVIKNSVARRALLDSGLESLSKVVDGPCGFVFVKGDPIATSRILCDFSKNHEPLRLQGGFLRDKILEEKDIQALSRLPAREVLLTQIVIALNSPISKLAMTLNQVLRNFVYCLDQIKQKKEKQ